MIKKFLKYNKMNEAFRRESREEELVNQILDRISKVGYKNISNHEKEILNVSSAEGYEGVERYIDKSDDDVLTYDKLGHFLINGMGYQEWIDQEKNPKSKPKSNDGWKDTPIAKPTGPILPDYKVRIYKNDNSKKLYYYLFWGNDDDIPEVMRYKIQKWISIDDIEPFGKLLGTGKKSWKNKSMEEIHKSDLYNDYEHFKDLTNPKELNAFETFLKLRIRFKKHELNDVKNNAKETKRNRSLVKELRRLYKMFCNV